MTPFSKSGFIPWDHSGDEFFKRKIAAFEEIWRAGSPLAPLALSAVNLCNEFGCRVWPEWVTAALAEVNRADIAGRKKTRRGRQATVARYEQERNIHLRRWRFASIALANRHQLPADGFPATREGAWEWASLKLRGAVGKGEPGSIERSYKLIEKAIRNGKGALYGVVDSNP